MDGSDLIQGDRGRTDETVPDRQDGFSRDRKRRVVEEVVRLCDGSYELARERYELGALREEEIAGRSTVRAVASGIANAHLLGHCSHPLRPCPASGTASRRRREGTPTSAPTGALRR